MHPASVVAATAKARSATPSEEIAELNQPRPTTTIELSFFDTRLSLLS